MKTQQNRSFHAPSIAALMLPLLLAACGGGGGDTQQKAQQCSVQSVTITPAQGQVQAGQTLQFAAAPVVGPTGCTGTPDSTATWSSSDTQKASITSSGEVKGISAGNTTIVARIGDKTASAPLVVTAVPVACTVQSLTLSGAGKEIQVGQTAQLQATPVVGPSGCVGTANTTVSWTSSDPAKATVDGQGNIKAVSAGTVTITAKTGDKTAAFTLTVTTASVACAVQAIELSGAAKELQVGQSAQLQATPVVGPSGCVGTANTTVSWTSSDPTKATVDTQGNIKAVSVGTVTITAKAGDKTAAFIVTVTAAPVACSVQGVKLSPATASVQSGQTLTLSATPVIGPDGCSGKPNTGVTWTSNDVGKATVDAQGNVKALAAGTLTITARIGDKTATSDVTVTAAPVACAIQAVTLPATSGQLQTGQTAQLKATAVVGPSGCVGTADTTISWTSSDPSKATVDAQGNIKAVSAGTVTITAKAGDKTVTYALTIIVPSVACTVQSINLTPATVSLQAGQTTQLTATPVIGPSGCVGTADTAVTWLSNDPGKATVNGAGLVTAVAAGATTITAKIGDKTATSAITVTAAPIACAIQAVTLPATSGQLQTGQTTQLKATPVVGPSGCVGTADTTVSWTSSDPGKATVDAQGNIKAVSAGTVTITAKVGDKTGVYALTVTAAPVACTVQSVTLSATNGQLQTGQTTQLKATPVVGPSGCVGTADTTISWISSDPGKATVDAQGNIKAVSAGAVTITAKVDDKTAVYALTITSAPVACMVQSVTVSPSSGALTVGQTLQLSVTPVIGPAGCTGTANTTTTWVSSDPSKATVSASGLVTAVGSGTATITVTVGGKAATAMLTVALPPRDMKLAPTANFLIMKVTQAEKDLLDKGDTSLFKGLSQVALSRVTEDFDNIFFISNNESTPTGSPYVGVNLSVSNNVSGIGIGQYNNTAAYGSAGKLKSVMHLQMRRGMTGGPSLHEFAHNWANNVIDTGRPGHWNFSSGGLQLGGFDPSTFKSLGNNAYQANNGKGKSFGTFANGGNGVPYGELELYLMGMLDASQVRPIIVANGAAYTDAANGIFTATNINTVTIQDLVTKYGPRTPSLSDSQKEFRVLNVLLTVADPTATELQEVGADINEFSLAGEDGKAWLYNFWEATRGLGKLNMGGLTLKP